MRMRQIVFGETSPRLWIALTRPDNLVSALAAAAVGRRYFSSCHLIYEESDWWHKAKWESYRNCFDEVYAIKKVTTCRGLRDLRRVYQGLRERQQQLKGLLIAPQDTLFLLAGITVLSNAIASAYPQVFKVLCTTAQKYREANLTTTLRSYRPTTSGWLQNNFLEPRVGLHRTLHLKPWYGRGDGIRIKRLAAPLEKVFNAILLLSNDGCERPDSAANAKLARFPKLRELGDPSLSLDREIGGGKRVIFFGTPFLLVRNLAPEIYAARLNGCLDYLRRCYPSSELIYRPHPAETKESQMLGLDRFAVELDGDVAELYLLRHARETAAVFSVSSTVSRVALNYGFNAYAFWRCFPFPPKAAAYFENVMGSVPPEFKLSQLDQPPRRYQSQPTLAGDARDFSEAIAEIARPRAAEMMPSSNR
jgi:hypothetical protein